VAELRVFGSLPLLSQAAAEAAAEVIDSGVRARGVCTIALAGGSTPAQMYEYLATESGAKIPWQHVQVFWGDERIVPLGDTQRNDRMAREMLFSKVPCPESNIHPMATRADQTPDAAAREYEETMRQQFAEGRPRFDLVILGIGADGHTASLFPQSPALNEVERWVCAVQAPAVPHSRLTLTLPVLSEASNVYVLASGSSKAGALRAALHSTTDPRLCPAAALRSFNGRVTWWADAPAAGAHSDSDPDMHKGAVEGTEHDPIVPIEPNGANFDDSEVSNADEKGQTTDHPRDEQR
jgi:6-phosphogluconolactonase